MTAVQEDRPPGSLKADDAGFGRCDVILSVVGRSRGEGSGAVREGICPQEVAASQILCGERGERTKHRALKDVSRYVGVEQ
jgi:hypothetical protein